MDPETLYALFEKARAEGEAESIHVARCSKRRCRVVGEYHLRGTDLSVATPVKLSSAKKEQFGVTGNIPGRAWLGPIPSGEIVGCDHFVVRLDESARPDGVIVT